MGWFSAGSSDYLTDWWTISADANEMESRLELLETDDPQDSPSSLTNQVYFFERYLHFPMMAAWLLNRAGFYGAAHEWYLRLYHPFKRKAERHRFPFDVYFKDRLERDENWLIDPFDPGQVAGRRRGVYLKAIILLMVKNLLDWADDEYAIENPESVNRARDLYQLAQRILQAPDLGGSCLGIVQQLLLVYVNSGARAQPGNRQFQASIGRLYGIRNRNVLDAADTDIRTINQTVGSRQERFDRINAVVSKALADDGAFDDGLTITETLTAFDESLNRFEEYQFYGAAGVTPNKEPLPGNGSGNPPTDPEDLDKFGRGFEFPKYDRDFFSKLKPYKPQDDFTASGGKYGGGYVGPSGGNGIPAPGPPPGAGPVTFCIPANPLLKALNYRIECNLLKIAKGLSIAGEPLPTVPYSCAGAQGMPEGLSGEAVEYTNLDGLRLPAEPPRYRYSYLVEKAKQCIEVAERLGGAYLQAIEKKDEVEYRVMLARHTLELGGAKVTLRELGVRESLHGRDVAQLQLKRAGTQQTFWDDRINHGMLSNTEKLGLGLMLFSASLQGAAAAAYFTMAAPAIIATGLTGTVTAAGGEFAMLGGGATMVGGIAGGIANSWTGVGGLAGLVATVSGAAALGGGAVTVAGAAVTTPIAMALVGGEHGASGLQAAGGAVATLAGAVNQYAAYERRWEDWTLQDALAKIDTRIANAGVILAQDKTDIANQELHIANLEQAQAQEVVTFLTRESFANEILYEWMIGVLRDLYQNVMQVATSVARLAQNALEFERQESINIILGNYWTVHAKALSTAQKNSGLLGAERLMTDLVRMDAYKLQTDRRRLHLSKTISLARTMTSELVKLRAGEPITFNTLMDWFDWDFPNHYMRLIKSVKVTVLALVSPTEGIHAMLSNGGESSVVVLENGEFVKKRAMRNFGDAIALDSPYNETGLFVLDYNDPMFLPFEGLGVETQWTLELPSATNRFDMNTLVDVLFTIEYTALHSPDYRNKPATEMPTTLTTDTALAMHTCFPDQWYHLKNPVRRSDGTVGAQSIQLEVFNGLFPPNLDPASLRLLHLQLIVAGRFADASQETQDAIKRSIVESITVAESSLVFTSSTTAPLAGGAAPLFQDPDFQNLYAVFTTRKLGTDQQSPIPGTVSPKGVWAVNLDSPIYAPPKNAAGASIANQPPIIDRIDDIVVVLTVKGDVKW